MAKSRPYPPDFCKAETMAYMLDMSETTFRNLVADRILPKGRMIGGLRLWSRQEVYEALEARKATDFNGRLNDDPISRAIHGTQEETRRGPAAARS